MRVCVALGVSGVYVRLSVSLDVNAIVTYIIPFHTCGIQRLATYLSVARWHKRSLSGCSGL